MAEHVSQTPSPVPRPGAIDRREHRWTGITSQEEFKITLGLGICDHRHATRMVGITR
jgi:hypothetical protein